MEGAKVPANRYLLVVRELTPGARVRAPFTYLRALT